MAFESHYEFRSRLFEAVARDLVGPARQDEIETISDPPLTRYIAGILYPQTGAVVDADQDVDVSDDDGGDEGFAPDPPVAMANVRFPSSMGFTFAVDSTSTAGITITIEAARYEKISPDSGEGSSAKRPRRGGLGPTEPWRRVPLNLEPVQISVTEVTAGRRVTVSDGLELFYRVRAADSSGIVSVTVVLLNRFTAVPGARDAVSFFQPKLIARAVEMDRPVFVERPSRDLKGNDDDLRVYRLLYRHAVGFAVGHGCSVEWAVAPDSSRRATEIRTCFTPRYDLLLADSNPAIKSVSMKRLAEGERSEVISELQLLVQGYRGWIRDRVKEANSFPGELRQTAAENLKECRSALHRMTSGLQLLAADSIAWRAFQLANAAMLEQRARTVWLKAGKPTPEPARNETHQWRPFQIAFVLLCVRGIVDPSSEDRSIADLLWFPTGGGKTEAYLGLIAFTTFLRRLRSPAQGGGVTVLMRYTLRLLTIQQFERAAMLICCCEYQRRKYPQLLGADPIRIGLWVGRGATPNSLDEARAALNKFRQGTIPTEKNPVQLRSCPWCGKALDHRNYYLADRDRRLVIACRDEKCQFEAELPVCVVDEDIYARRPTLIIATVDKFAGLPWNDRTAALFNIGRPEPPPELIIQDELHLISGPLGTLTGLYETAIDFACNREGIAPKVVASTATIRRAANQVRGIFDRNVRQFPPPGIDGRDSYFAKEVGPSQKGTRLYVGLMAPGTSQTTLMVRTYAALLQFCSDIPGSPDTKDPYWTLVGYFNSLRVLAGAKLQVQDDVEDRVELLARESTTPKRAIDEQIEMTSRESSADIPNHLKRMAVSYPDKATLDIILATNMISVGVDIDRLGLMVVMGQPQATSEYIQATSRVGRQFPGLVFTLFNASRSRDRSHYESFVTYHSALYRQVESTSVTPFSSRARDRGLHAVLIALARLTMNEYRPNDSASRVENLATKLSAAVETIISRVDSISQEEAAATRRQLNAIISTWILAADDNPNLVFANYFHPDRALLVDAARDDIDMERKFATLQSLRDVDMSSNLYLVR